jgi:hypothetical protein
MDPYTSESAESSARGSQSAPMGDSELPTVSAQVRFREPLRFPAEDDGRSLGDMAQRDLDAALQLLAERAQYITGASGAAIALGDAQTMVCRASCGPCAPKVGCALPANSGLSGQSMRSGQILCCSNAAEDTRVDRESCRALGISSAMVMPLRRDKNVIGVFEIFSSRPHAFEERDLVALQRLGEMILTAIQHADAADDARTLIAAAGVPLGESSARAIFPVEDETFAPSAVGLLPDAGVVGTCGNCGFPVSEGRTLCLDCENSRRPRVAGPGTSSQTAASTETNWWRAHKYLLGTMLVAAIAVTAVIFLR